MKVLHLIQRYPPAVGGSETWCREVCQCLATAGDEMKVLTLDVVEEEEYWSDPPVDRCAIRLGRLAWDHRVLVRRYKRSLPVHTLYHSLLKVVLDGWLRIYSYGPHSVEMYGRLLSEARTADVVALTRVVPFLVEDELKRLGGLYEKAADWASFVVTDGRLVTGQNPASSRAGAEALLKLLA